MKRRGSSSAFFVLELLGLLAVVVPVAHLRSLVERLASPSRDLTEWASDEPLFIVLRSLLVVLAVQGAFALRNLYRWSVLVRPQLVVMRLLESLTGVLVGLLLLYSLLGAATREFGSATGLARLQIHPLLLPGCLGVAFLFAYALRMRWPNWVRGTGFSERVALAGRGPGVDLLEEALARAHDPSIELAGFVDDAGAPPQRNCLGELSAADTVARHHAVERMVVASEQTLDNETMLRLRMNGVRITGANSFYERLTGRISPESLSDPELFLTSAGPNLGARFARRLVDVLIAGVGLLIASPLLIVIAIAIKIESRGPIFYSQERVGLNGRSFTISKLRSMRADAETKSGPVWAQTQDPRITRIGKWLRKLRIDEIPQLWCVLVNDMTLVGPRPERPHFVAELSEEIPHYGRRHLVKPGVTGWAQINYSYGNSVDDAFIKLQYDLYYVKHRTMALDAAVLLRTIKVVVLQEGAV